MKKSDHLYALLSDNTQGGGLEILKLSDPSYPVLWSRIKLGSAYPISTME